MIRWPDDGPRFGLDFHPAEPLRRHGLVEDGSSHAFERRLGRRRNQCCVCVGRSGSRAFGVCNLEGDPEGLGTIEAEH
jgi:hypothetical protein